MSRRGLRRGTSIALARCGGMRALDAYWGPERLTVLAYHRIAPYPGPEFPYLPDLVSASPAEFAVHVEWAARHFSVIGLDDLVAHVRDGTPLPPRPLMFTFDDGYLDNYEYAYPVLRAHGLPAVIFLITGAIGTNRVMWWDEVAALFRASDRPRADIPLLGPTDISDPARRVAARCAVLRAFKEVAEAQKGEALRTLGEALGVEPVAPERPLFMDWDQVREVVDAGIACQPHTDTHPILTRIPADEVRAQLERSAAIIRERTGRPTPGFAYPNGGAADFDAAAIAALEECGFEVAFTMEPGPVSLAKVRDRPFEIERVVVHHLDPMPLVQLRVMGMTLMSDWAHSVVGALRHPGRPVQERPERLGRRRPPRPAAAPSGPGSARGRAGTVNGRPAPR